jgi:hypothetical protein
VNFPVADFACDANNDGVLDDADGELNLALGSGTIGDLIASQLGPLDDTLAEELAENSLLLVGDMQSYDGTPDKPFWTNMYLGEEPLDGCLDIDITTDDAGAVISTASNGETCDFSIDPDSFASDGCPIIALPSTVNADGVFSAGPGDFSFGLPLGALTLELLIESGRIAGDLSGKGNIANAVLCGTVTKDTLVGAIEAYCDSPDAETAVCAAAPLLPTLLDCGDENCTVTLHFEAHEAGNFVLPTDGI